MEKTVWKGVLTGKIHRVDESYTTILGKNRKVVRVRTIVSRSGGKTFFLVSNLGAQLEEVKPLAKLSNEKFPRIACVAHNGEHPFSYKETVNGFVTACHEVMSCADYEEAKEKFEVN